MKNQQYIAMKRERLQAEIRSIERAMAERKLPALFYPGPGRGKARQPAYLHTMPAVRALKLKHYQQELLAIIERFDERTLAEVLASFRAKLCEHCQSSLIKSVPQCSRDFMNFITCDMIYQALGLNFVAKGMEVPQ